MADRVAIARTYDPVEVDLWGKDFKTVDLTRSGSKKVAALEAELNELKDSDVDGAVSAIGALLDLKLTSAGGSNAKASTQIKKKWEGDQLSLADLLDFLYRLATADAERPT